MPTKTCRSGTRLATRFVAITALISTSVGFAAAGSQVARTHRLISPDKVADSPDNLLTCHGGTDQGRRFSVGVKESKIHEVIMCTDGSSTQSSVDAQALAVGLSRASDSPTITRETQLSALIRLRSIRTRNVENTLLSAEERDGRLAIIDRTIVALEKDLGILGKGRSQSN